jgi:hypothetical protein
MECTDQYRSIVLTSHLKIVKKLIIAIFKFQHPNNQLLLKGKSLLRIVSPKNSFIFFHSFIYENFFKIRFHFN